MTPRAFLALALLGASCSPITVKGRERHGAYELVTYEWSDLWGPCPKTHTERCLYGPGGQRVASRVGALSDSPDGRWSVGQSPDHGGLFLLDHARGAVVRPEGNGKFSGAGDWSPRGCRALVWQADHGRNLHGLVLLELEGESPVFTPVFLRPWGRPSIEYSGWSPEGESVAFLSRGPGDATFDLVQIRLFPQPREVLREPLEKVDRFWVRYEIVWEGERPRARLRP